MEKKQTFNITSTGKQDSFGEPVYDIEYINSIGSTALAPLSLKFQLRKELTDTLDRVIPLFAKHPQGKLTITFSFETEEQPETGQ